MSTAVFLAAGTLCVLYTAYEMGRIVQRARDGASGRAFAYDVETGERVPLFVERRRRGQRRADDC